MPFRTLHKVYTFVEAQQNGSKIKKFFRQGEMIGLFKECKVGLQQALDVFTVREIQFEAIGGYLQRRADSGG